MNKPLVSVLVITYNHEGFIAKALDSIVTQKVNFPIEIVVGEDCSSDSTAEIIKSYTQEYPNLIKPRFHNPNLGVGANLLDTWSRCEGKYIAVLEGDDYWTDSNKLQRQLDFMEMNPEYSMVFHNASISQNSEENVSELFANIDNKDYNNFEILDEWIIPTASSFFRKEMLPAFPNFFEQAVHQDIIMFLMAAEAGKVRGMSDIMSVYRKNEGSITDAITTSDVLVKKLIQQYRNMRIYFGPKYKSILSKYFGYYRILLLHIYKNQGYVFKGYRHLFKGLTESPFYVLGRMLNGFFRKF